MKMGGRFHISVITGLFLLLLGIKTPTTGTANAQDTEDGEPEQEQCDYRWASSDPSRAEPKWIVDDVKGLNSRLYKRLHGQDLVKEIVFRSVKGFVSNPDPPKALGLSFHGPTGVGKNYVAGFIAESLYTRGLNSDFVHLKLGTRHFPHKENLRQYQEELVDWIESNVKQCARSLFILDEVDKVPDGLIDVIKPYLDNHPIIDGVDYRKAIFIFLSNIGASDIVEYTRVKLKSGVKREDIRHKDMDELLTKAAFNRVGGFFRGVLAKCKLINAFVGFLPLERTHILECAKDSIRKRGLKFTPGQLEAIANRTSFQGDFAQYGCRHVDHLTDLELEPEVTVQESEDAEPKDEL